MLGRMSTSTRLVEVWRWVAIFKTTAFLVFLMLLLLDILERYDGNLGLSWEYLLVILAVATPIVCISFAYAQNL